MLGVFLLPLGRGMEVQEAKAQSTGPWHFVAHNQSFSPTGSLILVEAYTSPEFDVLKDCTDERKVYVDNHADQLVGQCVGPEGEGLGSSTFVNVYDANGKKVPPQGKGLDFDCNPVNPFSLFSDCIAWFLYHIIFEPLAWITRGAADILDYFIYYSTNDESYRNSFVEKGWGAVRDIANILFIVGLLFVAIKTILNLNTTNNKKMLGNIIIFALLINFSLFATQVIVDASNILAKIFYHQITPVDKDGTPLEANVEQRSITVGLVRTFDPQDLINAKPNDSGEINVGEQTGQIILITILAIVLMGFMIYIFISVAFLFVARTVSIWMAMIFAPLAFASHAISTKIKGFGWDEWLPNLLKNAFLAPIFIFFLYIIVIFGDLFKLGGVSATGGEDTNIAAFMATFIPFMLIFVLLMQARKLAVNYSGEIGSAISKGAVAAIGLGAGAAFATTAFAGRKVIGGTLARASRGETLTQRYEKDPNSLSGYKQILGQLGSKMKLGKVFGRDQGLVDIKTKRAIGVSTGLGGLVNKSQIKASWVDHSRDDLDKYKKEAHLEGVANGNLSGQDILTIKDKFVKDKKGTIQDDIKTGATNLYDTNGNVLRNATGQDIKGQDAFEAYRRQGLIRQMQLDPNAYAAGDVDAHQDLTETGKKKIENMLKVEFSAILKKTTEKETEKKFTTMINDSKEKVSVGQRLAANSTGSSYDARGLNKITANNKASLGFKGTAMLITAIAGAIRLGMKKGVGAEPGKVHGDFGKDISSLIKDSLNVKIDLGGSDAGHAPKPDHGQAGGGGHH